MHIQLNSVCILHKEKSGLFQHDLEFYPFVYTISSFLFIEKYSVVEFCHNLFIFLSVEYFGCFKILVITVRRML